MNTASLLSRKGLEDSFQRITFLMVMTLMAGFNQMVMAKSNSQPTPPLTTLASFCDANALRAFPEMSSSLKCTPIPELYTLDETDMQTHVPLSPNIIKDNKALIALGKMLFWDAQVGSDGLACASCHFQAGADNRIKNQIDPGVRNASGEFARDRTTPIGHVFDFMASDPKKADPLPPMAGKGPNYTLKKADFPFRQYWEDPNGDHQQSDRNAEITFDSDDVVSSQGVYHSTFNSLTPSGKKEKCTKRFPTSGPDMPLFNVTGYSVRQVEPRNTPTVINAVFNFRNFWDGRANNVFNGLDPFGLRRFADPATTPATSIYTYAKGQGRNAKGAFVKKQLAIYNASLASQAVGPALSDFEMSCGGKDFAELGKKMLTRKPLNNQKVDPTDSVLGTYTLPNGTIMPTHTYKLLIQKAFNNTYWDVPDTQTIDGYKLIENNFSLFWGLAVQAYESTLVSDNSRFDQAQEDLTYGQGSDKLTDQEIRGKSIFVGQGNCVSCHGGAEFSNASVTHVTNPANEPGLGKYTERMLMGDGGIALYDSGFYNIGVRPSKEDLGVGATDAYGHALSFTRNAKKNSPNDPYANNANLASLAPDPFQANSDLFFAGTSPVASDEREAVDGAFKAPSLRNVELTGPYFHNGGQATLEQVVRFYNRGGDRKDLFQKDPVCGGPLLNDWGMVAADPVTGLIDSSGYFLPDSSGQASNIAPDIAGAKDLLNTICGLPPEESLRLSSDQIADLVAFLKTLTDDRVRWEQAPFDHPSLTLPNGHVGDENSVKFNKATNQANQQTYVLPAVGAAGRQAKGLPALQTFDSGLK